MKNQLCYIYALIDPNDLSVGYVGKTIQSLEKRLGDHIREAKQKKNITHKNNFENEWQQLEKYYIQYFRKINNKLTNTCEGGLGGALPNTRSKQSRLKTSIALKKAYKEGRRKITKKHKQILREYMSNRVVSEKTKEKLRQHNLGKKQKESTKLKKSKTVYQYDMNNNFIQSFDSLTKAAKHVGCRKGSICNAIYGYNGTKSCKGFIWRYEKI